MTASWRARAACHGAATALFFPEADAEPVEALEICGRCHVRAECEEYASGHAEEFGVWGGRTETARRLDRPQSDPDRPCRPGPQPAVDDARLIELLRELDPGAPAAPQVLARLRVSVPAVYKYLNRAMALGVAEHRGRHIYSCR